MASEEIRSVYLVASRYASVQRAHFSLYIPSGALPGKGVLINVVGTPMSGFQLEVEEDYVLESTGQSYTADHLGNITKDQVPSLIQLAARVEPPKISKNFMAPVDGVQNRRCQEWTVDYVKHLIDRGYLPDTASQTVQARRDPPSFGVGLRPVTQG